MPATNPLAGIPTPSEKFDQVFPRPMPREGICGECGFLGLAERRKHGRDDLELILWGLLVWATAAYVVGSVIHHFLFIFPGMLIRGVGLLGKAFLVIGVLYTIWRLSTEFDACPKCGHGSMVPPDSPRGERIRRETGRDK